MSQEYCEGITIRSIKSSNDSICSSIMVASTVGRSSIPIFVQPTITITENDCSRYPEYLYVRYVVSGFPASIGAVVIRK
jgi:hypothetical protein